jgi:hypothetical protein
VSRFRRDPGPCPICGAPHCACGGGDPIEVVQLPQRDAAAAAADSAPPAAPTLVAEQVQATLPPGHFTSGTYRGTKKKTRDR